MVGCDLPRSAAVTHEFYVLWYAKQRTWYPLIKFYVHQMALEVRITLTIGYTEAHAILLSLAESSRQQAWQCKSCQRRSYSWTIFRRQLQARSGRICCGPISQIAYRRNWPDLAVQYRSPAAGGQCRPCLGQQPSPGGRAGNIMAPVAANMKPRLVACTAFMLSPTCVVAFCKCQSGVQGQAQGMASREPALGAGVSYGHECMYG